VRIEKEGEEFVQAENDQSFVIATGEKPVCLNSAERFYLADYNLP